LTFLSRLKVDDSLKLRALIALACALAVVAGVQIWILMRFQPLGIDFLPLWTAGRMAWLGHGHVYDFAAVSQAQGWLLPNFHWTRPYVYPPTALLLFAPFGAAPFWPALGLWLALNLGVFVYAGWRLSAARRRGLALVLMLLSPTVVLAALVGQSVLLVSGLLVLAMTDLARAPRRAGVWLALAAVLKPQALLLAPVALVASGAVETLAVTALVGSLIAAASAAVFGISLWPQWLASLPAFQKVVEASPALMSGVITPLGAANRLGLSGVAAAVWQAAFALAGAALVWRVFARQTDVAARTAVLAAGSLLAAPYAMHYDGALLVPAAVVLAVEQLETRAWALAALALFAVCEITTQGAGLLALASFAVLAAWIARPFGEARPVRAAGVA
jgi:hypothetical protein